MSWSTHDKYLATSTGDNVSVWRLPRKSQLKHGRRNNKSDTLSMFADDNVAEVVKTGFDFGQITDGRQ